MNTPLKPALVAAAAALALVAGPTSTHGQDFNIRWATFDSGGGAASGGAYAINGTAGQPDAHGPMSGGAFSLSSGFWPEVSEIGSLPPLSIRLGTPSGGFNTVILSWPNPSTGYVLEQTANMNAPGGGWTVVAQSPVIVGPNLEVTLPATGSFCMFRLRRL